VASLRLAARIDKKKRMKAPLTFASGVTLVGAGRLTPAMLAQALARAPALIAADGGADSLLAMGHRPLAAIGDFDSISDATRATLGAQALIHDPGQDDTDFDKALRRIAAPLVLALGFTGDRMDHTLAAMNTLARNPRRPIVLEADADLCALCPPRLALDLPPGCRVSLMPLAQVRCASAGLRWQTEGLTFDPMGRIGTSNAATGPVTLAPDAPRLLVMVPVAALDPLIAGLAAAPSWP
jgi:thiamine pyrophosphokinase